LCEEKEDNFPKKKHSDLATRDARNYLRKTAKDHSATGAKNPGRRRCVRPGYSYRRLQVRQGRHARGGGKAKDEPSPAVTAGVMIAAVMTAGFMMATAWRRS
jgi:hypothetical protein